MSEYPKVMRHNVNGVIVKFTEYGIGTVLGKGHTGGFGVGYHSTTWLMDVFKDYKPEVFRTMDSL